MQFRKHGKGYHLVIESVQDLADAATLDDALWVATAAPIDSFRIDPVMLDLMDIHDDHRITAAEVKTAIQWTLAHLLKHDPIERGETILRKENINTDAPNGQSIADAISKLTRKAQNDSVTLEQIRALKKEIETRPVSGSGVILPDAGKDEDIKTFLSDIIACTGGSPHPNGQQGVDDNALKTFQEQSRHYIAWFQEGLIPPETAVTLIKPFGENTQKAHTVFSALRAKFEQYFTQCQAVRLDNALQSRVWPRDCKVEIQDTANTEEINNVLKRAPLAAPHEQATFSFSEPANPYYADLLTSFKTLITPDSETITATEWESLCKQFAAYQDWQARKPGNIFDSLGLEKLEEYQSDKYTKAVTVLIQSSRTSSIAFDQICLAEKLSLYQGFLFLFVNNFVSFPDLYDADKRALFEEGTVIMDGRRFNMAVRVFNRKDHIAITQKGAMFVMYLELERGDSVQRYEIAVPVAAGTRGCLVEGKRGIFQHVDGSEWNAKIVQIVDKPISLTEATLAPFIKLGSAVTGKIESLSATATQQLEKAGSETIGTIDKTAKTTTPATAPAPTSSAFNMGGTMAGIGVAVAALGSSFAFTIKMLAGIHWWQILAAIAGTILAVLIPTLLVAVLRLRKRDIKNILEGSGWAVNVSMRLTHSQKNYITSRPAKPNV